MTEPARTRWRAERSSLDKERHDRMALFQKRHYEWLARWAGENCTPEQIAQLASALRGTNSNYQHDKFLCRADDINAAQSPKRASDLLYLPRRRSSGAI